jgi:membrane protein YqaA with SNARE-associated domain
VLTSVEFTSEIKAMVVSAIVSGVLGGIMGFWMGTSFSSARKTELLKGN